MNATLKNGTKVKTMNTKNITTEKLIEAYEAKYGIQGNAIDFLSRKQLIDGLTNPAHIPARNRFQVRQ